MITTTSADGTRVRALDEGRGPAVLIVHGGLDDGRSWRKVATQLSDNFRVVRLQRRPYRVDVPCSMAQEVDDVLAVAAVIGERVLLVGHSSGGVLALETLVASPGAFAGAIIYEPPVVLGPPVGGKAAKRVRAAITGGKPGKAMSIFARDIAGMPPWAAWLGGLYVAGHSRYRALVPQQLHFEEIDALGVRLDAYAEIEVPTVLLLGDRSPAHLGERVDALAHTLPHAEKVVLCRQGHVAQRTAPGQLARIIETHANNQLPEP